MKDGIILSTKSSLIGNSQHNKIQGRNNLFEQVPAQFLLVGTLPGTEERELSTAWTNCLPCSGRSLCPFLTSPHPEVQHPVLHWVISISWTYLQNFISILFPPRLFILTQLHQWPMRACQVTRPICKPLYFLWSREPPNLLLHSLKRIAALCTSHQSC